MCCSRARCHGCETVTSFMFKQRRCAPCGGVATSSVPAVCPRLGCAKAHSRCAVLRRGHALLYYTIHDGQQGYSTWTHRLYCTAYRWVGRGQRSARVTSPGRRCTAVAEKRRAQPLRASESGGSLLAKYPARGAVAAGSGAVGERAPPPGSNTALINVLLLPVPLSSQRSVYPPVRCRTTSAGWTASNADGTAQQRRTLSAERKLIAHCDTQPLTPAHSALHSVHPSSALLHVR